MTVTREDLRTSSTTGKWVLVATILGSGVAFLDMTVVNVALPAIRRAFDATFTWQQWVIVAYMLVLGSLILLGGSLGDLLGRRRVFIIGMGWFGLASVLCGIAPTVELLVAARALQGVGAALLVPASLAIIQASFDQGDRGQAIGTWAGFSGLSTVVGPFLGGWLIDAFSWRLVFLINPPIIAFAIWVAVTYIPETSDPESDRPDVPGAISAALGLGGIVYVLIEAPRLG